MAKEIPWFKFTVSEWMTGNIVYEPFEIQGLFINICALYWKNLGVLEEKTIEERFKKKSLISKLSGRFYTVENGFISIDFLDEQLSEKQILSKINSINGSKGGVAKAKRSLSESQRPLSEPLAKPGNIEEEVEEEEDIEKELRDKSLPTKSVAQREEDFRLLLIPFVEGYSKETVRAFFEYWTEKNPNGKKMKFEMERVFEIKKRLATWKKKEKSFTQNNNQFNDKPKPTTFDRLADASAEARRLREEARSQSNDIGAQGDYAHYVPVD